MSLKRYSSVYCSNYFGLPQVRQAFAWRLLVHSVYHFPTYTLYLYHTYAVQAAGSLQFY